MNFGFLPWKITTPRLGQKRVYLLAKRRYSFCINLEVVILEVEIQRSFFGRIHDTIDCFRDLLTFTKSRWILMEDFELAQ